MGFNSECFNELSAEIKETTKETNSDTQNIDSKFDRLRAQILADVIKIKSVANNAIDIAAATEVSVKRKSNEH